MTDLEEFREYQKQKKEKGKPSRLDKYKEVLEKVGALKDAEEAMAYIEMAKPLVELGINTLFEFTPQLRRIMEAMVDASTDFRIRAIARYQAKGGFTKEEAMWLAVSDLTKLSERLQSVGNIVKSSKEIKN